MNDTIVALGIIIYISAFIGLILIAAMCPFPFITGVCQYVFMSSVMFIVSGIAMIIIGGLMKK